MSSNFMEQMQGSKEGQMAICTHAYDIWYQTWYDKVGAICCWRSCCRLISTHHLFINSQGYISKIDDTGSSEEWAWSNVRGHWKYFLHWTMCREIWLVARDKFGEKKGASVVLKRALYGLKKHKHLFIDTWVIFFVRWDPADQKLTNTYGYQNWITAMVTIVLQPTLMI